MSQSTPTQPANNTAAIIQLLIAFIPLAEQIYQQLTKDAPEGSVPSLADLQAQADAKFQTVIDNAS